MVGMIHPGDTTVVDIRPERCRQPHGPGLTASPDGRSLTVGVAHGIHEDVHHVDVEESRAEVVVTVWVGTVAEIAERMRGGEPVVITLQAKFWIRDIELSAPLGDRALRDGASDSHRPGSRRTTSGERAPIASSTPLRASEGMSPTVSSQVGDGPTAGSASRDDEDSGSRPDVGSMDDEQAVRDVIASGGTLDQAARVLVAVRQLSPIPAIKALRSGAAIDLRRAKEVIHRNLPDAQRANAERLWDELVEALDPADDTEPPIPDAR